jgi:hypothetical protein
MSDFHGGYSFANLGLVTLRRDGQGRGGLLQPRMVGFRIGWVGYRDKDLGSCLLNEAETGNQEVGISLVERDVRLGRTVGGKAKGRAHNVRHSLGLGLPNGFGGVLAAVTLVKKLVTLC